MRKWTRRKCLYAVGTVGVGSIAGCSSSSDDGSTASQTGTTTVESTPNRSTVPELAEYVDEANNFYGYTIDQTGLDEVTIAVGEGVDGFAFGPVAVHIDNGATVRWEWTGDGGVHNVVSKGDGPLDSGDPVGEAGSQYEHTFEQDGIYNYRCEVHGAAGMRGAVVVGTDYPRTERVPIDRDPAELTLTVADLPGDGWTPETSRGDSDSSHTVEFRRETDRGTGETVTNAVRVLDSERKAADAYAEFGYEEQFAMEPAETQRARIGVEAEWAAGQRDPNSYTNHVRLSHTNVASYVTWDQVNNNAEYTRTGFEEMRALSLDLISKWR